MKLACRTNRASHAEDGCIRLFAALHLEAARGRCRLLSGTSFKKPHHEDRKSSGFAGGWGVSEKAPGTLLVHAGSDGWWFVLAILDPTRRDAVTVSGRIHIEKGQMMDIRHLLQKPEFPRSAGYDPAWMMENQMGPNALWLVEWLAEALHLRPGMRVLDLGCGRAMTSIFLAKEFGVQVWATDFWITPDNNWQRAGKAGVADRVFPVRAEAHALPYPQGFFDAVVSIDAYQYFGTDELYLGYVSRFVRTDGLVGVVVPSLMQPVENGIPEHLTKPQTNGKVFWEDGCWSFKTADWWRDLWGRNSSVADVQIDTQPDGWRHWRDFEKALESTGKSIFPSDAEALHADQGRYIGFVRAIARRTGVQAMNLYDPSIALRLGVDTSGDP